MVLWRPFLSIIGGPSRTMKETLHSPTRESGGVWRMEQDGNLNKIHLNTISIVAHFFTCFFCS